jgi:uncharacterized OsmC-like protein
LSARAVGEVEKEGRILVLKRIAVTYRLGVEPGADRETIDRVLRVHADSCPVFRSLHPQIAITTALDLVEV